jgi:hypothetical protein
MTKVARTPVIRLTTGTTHLSIFQDTHAGIEQATGFWLVPFIGCLARNFHHRTFLNLLLREDNELNADDGLQIRSGRMKTSRHLLIQYI